MPKPHCNLTLEVRGNSTAVDQRPANEYRPLGSGAARSAAFNPRLSPAVNNNSSNNNNNKPPITISSAPATNTALHVVTARQPQNSRTLRRHKSDEYRPLGSNSTSTSTHRRPTSATESQQYKPFNSRTGNSNGNGNGNGNGSQQTLSPPESRPASRSPTDRPSLDELLESRLEELINSAPPTPSQDLLVAPTGNVVELQQLTRSIIDFSEPPDIHVDETLETPPHLDINYRRQLGSGSFSVVFEGSYHGERVAVKVVDSTHMAEWGRSSDNERKVHEAVKSLHVVDIYDVIPLSKTQVAVVLEYMSRGSLKAVLEQCGPYEVQSEGLRRSEKMPEREQVQEREAEAEEGQQQQQQGRQYLSAKQRITMLIDVCRGLSTLHHHVPHIVHRDISWDNVLVDDSYLCKLGDFGRMAATNDFGGNMTRDCGKAGWTAPEMVTDQYGPPSDMYGVGLLIFSMFTAQAPFESVAPLTILQRVISGDRPSFRLASFPSAELVTLMEDLWQKVPAKRPTVDETLLRLTHIRDSFR